jgi:hypothetical protein
MIFEKQKQKQDPRAVTLRRTEIYEFMKEGTISCPVSNGEKNAVLKIKKQTL